MAALVNHAFNTSVDGVFGQFQSGFFKVCEVNLVDLFRPEQLQTVMVGQDDYDWDAFKLVRRNGNFQMGYIGKNF